MEKTLVNLQTRGKGQIVELTLLTLYNQKLIGELAEEWGIQPATLGQDTDFEPRLIPIDPKEVNRMPEDLRRQVRESAISDEELKEQNITRLFNMYVAKQREADSKVSTKTKQREADSEVSTKAKQREADSKISTETTGMEKEKEK